VIKKKNDLKKKKKKSKLKIVYSTVSTCTSCLPFIGHVVLNMIIILISINHGVLTVSGS